MSTRRPAGARKRGRPAEFDREAALDAALATFWRRGYGNASLGELTAAMHINRPSLYGAFGNKQRLYAASVAHYVATIGATYLAPLAEPRLADALNGFFDAMIEGVTGKHGPRGCVVACTMPAEAGVSPAAQAQLAAVLEQIDGAWSARLAAARAAGEIARRRDPRVLGQLVASGMLALSIRARAGAPKRTLRAIANEIVAAVLAE